LAQAGLIDKAAGYIARGGQITHLGTSAVTARSAKAEIAKSGYCSSFPAATCAKESGANRVTFK
jgi:hypothetical protein